MFKELSKKHDDITAINEMFASEGHSLYRQMQDAWFKAGVLDASEDKPIALDWCEPYVCGYRAQQAVMTQLTKACGACGGSGCCSKCQGSGMVN